MSRFTPGRTGPLAHWYRKARLEFLAAFPTCWQCGHGGSDNVDHYYQASTHPHLAYEMWNWRPSHGWRKCPTCGRRCNQERGTTPGPPVHSPQSRSW